MKLKVIDNCGTPRLNQQQIQIIVARKDLQAAARQTQFALDGLIGVGHRAHEDAHAAAAARTSELRFQQLWRVLLDDQRPAPLLALLASIMPIGQVLRVTIFAAVDRPESAADRPGQAMRVGMLARGEETALLWREDALGLDVSNVHWIFHALQSCSLMIPNSRSGATW